MKNESINNPLVSVAVVTYNSSATIIETLDSIAAQTYQNLELIVSDDCSKDNTVEMVSVWISEHKERFVRTELLTVSKNTGVSANYNRAAAACKGEWIKDLDGDDLLLPDCIQMYIDFVLAHPETIYVFAKAECFGIDNEQVNYINTRYNDDVFYNWPKYEQLKYLYLCGSPIVSSTAFYNRKKYIDYGIFNDERIENFEDRPKWINILERNIPFIFINKVTVRYRISETSLSTGKQLSPSFSLALAKFDLYYRVPYMYKMGHRCLAIRFWFVAKRATSTCFISHGFYKVVCKLLKIINGPISLNKVQKAFGIKCFIS